MKTLKISIVILALLFIYACNDEMPQTDRNVVDIKTSSTFTNPYDSIGIVHNLIMEEIILLQDDLYEVCDSADFHNTFIEVVAEASCNVGWNTPTTNCESNLITQMNDIINDLNTNYDNLSDIAEEVLSSSALS